MNDEYDDNEIFALVKQEYADNLRGAVILALVKFIIAVAIFVNVFMQYGAIVSAVGGFLLYLALAPSFFQFSSIYYRFFKRRW